jgi:hypothetical protein
MVNELLPMPDVPQNITYDAGSPTMIQVLFNLAAKSTRTHDKTAQHLERGLQACLLGSGQSAAQEIAAGERAGQ